MLIILVPFVLVIPMQSTAWALLSLSELLVYFPKEGNFPLMSLFFFCIRIVKKTKVRLKRVIFKISTLHLFLSLDMICLACEVLGTWWKSFFFLNSIFNNSNIHSFFEDGN